MGQVVLAFVAAVKGGGRSGRCRGDGGRCRYVGLWRRMGRGWVVWRRQPAPRKPKGPLRGTQIFFHRGHSRQKGVYQEDHLAPRGREGRHQ